MVNQGDIIKVSFSPQKGHEQAGYRPAVVISNNEFNRHTCMALVCPISNTDRNFPLHIPLDDRTKTTGYVFCEHVRSLDLTARQYIFVEKIPADLLEQIINIEIAMIEEI